MADDKVKITEDIRSTDLTSNYRFPIGFPILFDSVKYEVKMFSNNESILKITEDIRSTDLTSNYRFPIGFPILFDSVKYEVKMTNTNENIYKIMNNEVC